MAFMLPFQQVPVKIILIFGFGLIRRDQCKMTVIIICRGIKSERIFAVQLISYFGTKIYIVKLPVGIFSVFTNPFIIIVAFVETKMCVDRPFFCFARNFIMNSLCVETSVMKLYFITEVSTHREFIIKFRAEQKNE